MFLTITILLISLLCVIKSSMLATKYAVRLAHNFRISTYLVGFIIISIISILPETLISINASLAGIPSFGLGTLFGSNVADLTLVFAIIILFSGRDIKIQKTILKNNMLYPLLLLIPIILGFDGYYSRIEGTALLLTGSIFYFFSFRNETKKAHLKNHHNHPIKNLSFLLISMIVLLVGSYFTVNSATHLANTLAINPILIGMFVVGIGTTIPELLFSLQAVKKHRDSLALGDMLGTVLADATIVVGILALIQPFTFPSKIVYVTGMFMFVAACILISFMRTERTLSKKEVLFLFLFWILFVCTEYFINT